MRPTLRISVQIAAICFMCQTKKKITCDLCYTYSAVSTLRCPLDLGIAHHEALHDVCRVCHRFFHEKVWKTET